jgi:hypothetical protein
VDFLELKQDNPSLVTMVSQLSDCDPAEIVVGAAGIESASVGR